MFKYSAFFVVLILAFVFFINKDIIASEIGYEESEKNYLVGDILVEHSFEDIKEVMFIGNDSILEDSPSSIFESIGSFEITAYSSTVGQTDDTPFIMASGKHVYDGAIAANFLPIGTKVRFPDLYGEKIFTVEDRMHSRFQKRVDIWFETRTEAKIFGIKHTKVEIVK